MTNRLFYTIMFSLSLFAACGKHKSTPCRGEVLTFTNLTGFDGCGWILEDGTRRYEPVNLGAFNISPEEGKEYCVEFTELKNNLSACMVGPIIEIKHISPLD